MSLTKEKVLEKTRNGYDVFCHYLGSSLTAPNKAFKNPFYSDTKASCYVYADKHTKIFKIKDFGDPEFSGDCFFLVGKIKKLSCDDKHDFIAILKLINTDLRLDLDDSYEKTERIISQSEGKVVRASRLPSVHDAFETAQSSVPIQARDFSPTELSFWAQYGIRREVLSRYHVIAVQRYKGIGKTGKGYELNSTDEEPIFGYQGRRFTKLYMPNSKLRFLYTGEVTEHYTFGFDQLPLRGDILFITGGEKDVLSLAAHGFHAICFNSETANIPKNILRGLGYRFRHVVLLYDVDDTGIAAMSKLVKDHKEYQLRMLKLPLNGSKTSKDISDFFRMGNTADDLMMVFREMLDQIYEDTIATMRVCEIDFDNPPQAPDPLLMINSVTIGSPGNIVCVAGSEGSGKTNYLGGIISGAIRPYGIEIDTLGTTVRENISDHAVLLFDTEQSEYQLYKNLTYITTRSSLEKPPRWFRAYCLVGIARNERINMILESMDRYYYEYGGIHLVFIDGIADLLNGVNDEESSVHLIEELFRMAAIYNTLIVCVVHLAPSGMKLRGHLGSEVQRKAAGILLIEREEEQNSSVVKALKVRDGSPLDVPMTQFGWSKSEGRHVYMGEMSKEDSQQRKMSELKKAVEEIFRDRKSIHTKELQTALMDAFTVRDRTARSYITTLLESKIIEKSKQFPGNFRLAE
ncbi:MAG: hypothetical protein RJA20_2961 [Bacteroidota bacterium]|jgi:hypothetical protein